MARTRRDPTAARRSRVAAVQALFQSEQGGENPETVIDQFVRHRLGELPGQAESFEDGRVPDAEVPLFARIVRAAVRAAGHDRPHARRGAAADWPLARLDPVLRALMRAGGAELAMADGPPARSSSTNISTWRMASSPATSPGWRTACSTASPTCFAPPSSPKADRQRC